MKRVPWILVVLAAVLVGAAIFLRKQPERTPANLADTAPVAPGTGSFTPAKVDVAVPMPKPDLVAIQDGKTIDFSSGLPIVKDSDKDKAALEAALKQMEEAAAGVSFGAPQEPAKK